MRGKANGQPDPEPFDEEDSDEEDDEDENQGAREERVRGAGAHEFHDLITTAYDTARAEKLGGDVELRPEHVVELVRLCTMAISAKTKAMVLREAEKGDDRQAAIELDNVGHIAREYTKDDFTRLFVDPLVKTVRTRGWPGFAVSYMDSREMMPPERYGWVVYARLFVSW